MAVVAAAPAPGGIAIAAHPVHTVHAAPIIQSVHAVHTVPVVRTAVHTVPVIQAVHSAPVAVSHSSS